MRNPFDRDIKVAELEPSEFFKAKYAAPASPVEPPPVAVIAPKDTTRDTTKSMAKDTTGTSVPRSVVIQEPDTTHHYGNNVQIDFSNYVFHDSLDQSVPTDSTIMRMPKLANNLDTNGDYRVNKYKLNFTPDIIYGNAGYDTFYGVTGSTVMAFSDLMGDHQIVFVTNLLLDLKNSDYGLQYYYLPNRIDFGFGGFHSARFVYVDDPTYGVSLFRFLLYGGSISALYPFDRYDRMDFSLNYYSISKENLDYPDEPSQTRSVLVPTIAYTHDTSLWGMISPMNGTRYRFSVFGTPRLGVDGLSFLNVTGDYRTYLNLGHNYAVALRLAGGGSFGPNPQKFIIGGVDNWINRQFDGGYVPLQNAEDYLFLQVGTPLRGYDYVAEHRVKVRIVQLRVPLSFLRVGAGRTASPWTAESRRRHVLRRRLGVDQRPGLPGIHADTRWLRDDAGSSHGDGHRRENLLSRIPCKGRRCVGVELECFSPPKYYFSLGADF